jgi:transposase
MSKQRKKYTKEFKSEAVRLVTHEGYRCSEAARSLGVAPDLISRWRREQAEHYDDAFAGHGRLTPEQQQIRDLEKQVKRLQMEKEILKKAAAFFAKEST